VTLVRALENTLSAETVTAGSEAASATGFSAEPMSVLAPASADEVAEIMKWASGEAVGVLPFCGGSRLPAVPEDHPYVAVSTSRLSGVEIYEAADLTVTAGAGTPSTTVDRVLRENRQWTPFNPPRVEDRSLGGLVALGESGSLWMGYGELRNHVLGMTVVTGDGRVLRLGGRVVKNVAGYDLIKPMVGSAGTLAVMTSVCLRAYPEPAVELVLALTAPSIDDLAEAAQRVTTAPVMPVSSVLVDGTPKLAGSAGLVLRLHGAPSTVAADRATLEAHVGQLFEEVSTPNALLTDVRDRGADAPCCIEVSAYPSRLADLLGTVSLLDPVGILVDVYAGRARIGLAGTDPDALGRATLQLEAIGGALRVIRAEGPHGSAGVGSDLSPDEEDLTDRLRTAFDPAGVMWPARGQRSA
jgi:glycolate oxidase FAD binding subunit